jgi:hypothetical protein
VLVVRLRRINGGQQGAAWLIGTEPGMRAAIDLQKHARLSEAIASPSVSRSPAWMRGGRACGSEDPAHTGAAQKDVVLAR